MALNIIKRNSYAFPNGYRKYAAPARYLPWNGAFNSPSPGRFRVGATQVYNVGSVPADLSTFILNSPDGRSFTFQFVYNASVQTTGIKIPLPASGGSTAAQVQTAIAGVLGQAGGITFGSSGFVSFPWTYTTNFSTQFVIGWTIAGVPVAATGTQATVTAGAVSQMIYAVQPPIPGRFGKAYAWLHGV